MFLFRHFKLVKLVYLSHYSTAFIIDNDDSNSLYAHLSYVFKNNIKTKQRNMLPKDIVATESSAKSSLQSMLNATTESLSQTIEIESQEVILECKWSFDVSSGHGMYKQKSEDPDLNDNFMFLIYFVPLRMSSCVTNEIL